MEQINTFTEFLETTGAQLQLFDMGRRVVRLPRERFLQFEQTGIPYPFPLQKQAWFAMLFRDKADRQEPFIWFLRLPLDEQGKLLQAARDDLMHRLIERIGERMQAEKEGEQLEAALQDNPYSFKPREDRMAVFHARVSRILKTPPSKFYTHARDYFRGEPGWDQWSFVGYQGIADVAARLDQDDNESSVTKALDSMPAQPLVALAHCLENEQISRPLNTALLARARRELAQERPDPALLAALIRAGARSRAPELQQQMIRAVLQAPCGNHIELLTAISGRAWEQLLEPDCSLPFLERLAENSAGQEAFNLCMADLLYLPGMREPMLALMRDPQRSQQLSAAIGALFQGINQG
ncbi:MAG: DUF3549 family protein [Sedimenticola sp.]|nr:DUF3549 family protein [Sedimenticola sp.]